MLEIATVFSDRQTSVNNKLSHNHIFLPLQHLITKISVWVCTGPLQSGSCSGAHTAAESLNTTLRPGKGLSLSNPVGTESPANLQGRAAMPGWCMSKQQVQEQADSL